MRDTDKLGILKGKNRRLVGRMRASVGRCLKRRHSISIHGATVLQMDDAQQGGIRGHGDRLIEG